MQIQYIASPTNLRAEIILERRYIFKQQSDERLKGEGMFVSFAEIN